MDPEMADSIFIESRVPLRPDDAIAALIQPGKGRYLMQLRDPLDWIFFPGHWGLFGGAIEKGESDLETLCRELHEELELELSAEQVSYFTRIDLDLSFSGHGNIRRDFYRVEVEPDVVSKLTLREGAALRVFSAKEILLEPRVTPYDRWAIWLNEAQDRLIATSKPEVESGGSENEGKGL